MLGYGDGDEPGSRHPDLSFGQQACTYDLPTVARHDRFLRSRCIDRTHALAVDRPVDQADHTGAAQYIAQRHGNDSLSGGFRAFEILETDFRAAAGAAQK